MQILHYASNISSVLVTLVFFLLTLLCSIVGVKITFSKQFKEGEQEVNKGDFFNNLRFFFFFINIWNHIVGFFILTLILHSELMFTNRLYSNIINIICGITLLVIIILKYSIDIMNKDNKNNIIDKFNDMLVHSLINSFRIHSESDEILNWNSIKFNKFFLFISALTFVCYVIGFITLVKFAIKYFKGDKRVLIDIPRWILIYKSCFIILLFIFSVMGIICFIRVMYAMKSKVNDMKSQVNDMGNPGLEKI